MGYVQAVNTIVAPPPVNANVAAMAIPKTSFFIDFSSAFNVRRRLFYLHAENPRVLPLSADQFLVMQSRWKSLMSI
ncbi:MAG: hypothetical protein J1D88_09175 [Treponema sp.]|nr:hypothetical protein [Treponema sp.]